MGVGSDIATEPRSYYDVVTPQLPRRDSSVCSEHSVLPCRIGLADVWHRAVCLPSKGGGKVNVGSHGGFRWVHICQATAVEQIGRRKSASKPARHICSVDAAGEGNEGRMYRRKLLIPAFPYRHLYRKSRMYNCYIYGSDGADFLRYLYQPPNSNN
jgi:hypothetical protein